MSEKPAGIWDDFLDIFVAPSKVFQRRSDAKFGTAMLVLTVLFAVLYFATRGLMAPIIDAEITRQLANTPNLTPERLEAAKKAATTFGAIAAVVGVPIGLLVLGLVIWVVGRPVGARLSFSQGVTIATFSYFPKLLVGQVAAAIQAALLDEASLTSVYSVSLGLARFLDPASTGPALLAFLSRVDVFTLWVTVLIAIGLKQTGKITSGQAAFGAAIIWVLGALPTVLPALLRG